MQQKLIQICNQNITDQPSMKRRIFWAVFFTVFLDGRSTNLLRLFSGNLPAMFYAVFRLTRLTFRPQKRYEQVAPSGHEVS